MTHIVLAEVTASVSELKKNPMGRVAAGDGAAVAILNRNEPAFYCVPASAYEAMIERLDDLELNAIADARANDPLIKIALDDLRSSSPNASKFPLPLLTRYTLNHSQERL
ncbi:type II toxin-antitoxin system Phd/YefM family antitoxin [Agrobacterium vitis]|nr:antitoxin [Agrobacterium vitis]